MNLKQASKYLVITGALLIWIIKYLLRPLHTYNEFGTFFLGIAPNLFGSFLIPFGAYWFFNGQNYLLARIFRIQSDYDLKLVCSLGFLMLVVNEYLQKISFFGRTFDYYDILFSALGLMISYFIFSKMQRKDAVQIA
ncbi:MAG: hypothetical protein JST23_00390 [Bacteroidetes bacterium]|nr:hypothetical protein [Bacteroidota bacterium]